MINDANIFSVICLLDIKILDLLRKSNKLEKSDSKKCATQQN